MRHFATIIALLLTTTVVGTVGIHYTAEKPWFEAAYLALITLTTLGSRDVPAPGDTDAMVFIMAYLVSGLGIFSYGAFQLGQYIVNAQLRGAWEQRRMQKNIAALEDHFIVCGQGRMGRSICEHLQSRNRPFVVLDSDGERLEKVARLEGWPYIVGDATDDETLRAAGIDRARALAAALPSDADNLFVVMSARLLSQDVNIVARASDENSIIKLERAGATRVISPIHSAGVKMARFLLSPRVEEFLEITDERGGNLELVEIKVTDDSPYAGQKIIDTDLRSRGMLVVGMRKAAGTIVMAPGAHAEIEMGDSLFVFGTTHVLHAVTEAANS